MCAPLPILTDFSLQALNTFGIRATASHYLAVHSINDLHAVYADKVLMALPRLVLGGGSNLLFTRDFPGLVLHMGLTGRRVSSENETHIHVTASAGENWHEFVLWTLEKGWGGLENLSLIPGMVGAAPVQNIGAYGAEVKDRIHSLRVFDFQCGEVKVFNRADCAFAYRDSIFRQERDRYAILDVTFALSRQWEPDISYPEVADALSAAGCAAPSPTDISKAIIAIRRNKLPDPAVIGNAGSFFRNPAVSGAVYDALKRAHPGMPGYVQADGSFRIAAGWLIDQCGWKGKSGGNAGVYEKQALVLINRGQATGEDIVRLSRAIQMDVKNRFDLWLEPEPVFV